MEYNYKIAGNYWIFKTAYELEEDRETSLFRINQENIKNAYTCCVEFVEELPKIPGKVIVENREKKLYLDGDSIWVEMKNLSENVPVFVSNYSMNTPLKIRLWALKYYYPYSARMAHIWSAIDLPYQLLNHNRLTLHSSAIEVDGKTVAFLAPSGTGKSTQARLWSEHRDACQLNGDKNAIFCKNGIAYAAGLPFCGTSGICENYESKLGALVFLSQAKENAIRRLSGIEALKVLLDNCFGYRNVPGCMEKMVMLATEIFDKVPVYALTCTPDERAVDILEQAMKKERN